MSVRRRIAVIGSGVAGLSAAWVLQREADVSLYEADDRVGGHAHTHDVPGQDGHTLAIDSGFIVHNEVTYPTLLRIFAALGVATQASDMSMSIRCGGCGLEYAGGRGLSGLLPTARTAANPRYLWMLSEVVRFHRQARRLLASDDASDDPTLRQFLRRHGFSTYFTDHFVSPLVAAVWSCAPTRSGDYPARYLFVFLANHGILSVSGSPTWRTVVGGSARYVEKLAKELSAVHTSTPVRAITRTTGGVLVRDDADTLTAFDGVVIAAHPDQALRMLAEPTAVEARVLSAISYSRNPTVLHTDASVLPSSRRAQAAWNYYLPGCRTQPSAVHLSYNMNRLQRLATDEQYVVTLNGGDRVDQRRVIARMVYEHPVYTTESVAARAELPLLNDGVVAYAGAYHGWGFHEDGCRSGVEAAASLGVAW
jgi:predicted NAD/FAD-binding protein